MQAATQEKELKFELDPADAARIKRYLGQIAESKGQRRLTSVYYDTPDFRLHRADVTLRVRRAGRRVMQTVKAGGARSVLLDRPEWEREIKGLKPDLAVAADTPVEPILNGDARAHGAEALRPVFQTRIKRSLYRLARNGDNIDVALDQGEVDTGREQAPLCELAIELSKGDVAGLFDLAREVVALGALHPSATTKPDRGYALLGDGAGQGKDSGKAARRKTAIALAPGTPAGEAFRIIARACMGQLVANEAATLARDAGALHQMRVALRRLRAAISLFKAIVADDDRERGVERIKGELKWIGKQLGPARDADVFIVEVLAPQKKAKPGDRGIAWLFARFEEARAAGYAQASEAIRGQRYRKALIDVLAWIEAGPWSRTLDELKRLQREQPIARFAADELQRRHKKLKKGGKKLRRMEAEKRHKFRIRAKKLRYAVEFFADAFPAKKRAKRRKRALSALRDFQDALGALNDVATREKLAADVAFGPDGAASKKDARQHAFAAGLVLGTQEAHIPAMLAAAEKAHAKFRKVKPFWD
jgi:triphosphatase